MHVFIELVHLIYTENMNTFICWRIVSCGAKQYQCKKIITKEVTTLIMTRQLLQKIFKRPKAITINKSLYDEACYNKQCVYYYIIYILKT